MVSAKEKSGKKEEAISSISFRVAIPSRSSRYPRDTKKVWICVTTLLLKSASKFCFDLFARS